MGKPYYHESGQSQTGGGRTRIPVVAKLQTPPPPRIPILISCLSSNFIETAPPAGKYTGKEGGEKAFVKRKRIGRR